MTRPGRRAWTQGAVMLGAMTLLVGVAASQLDETTPVKAGLTASFVMLSALPLLLAHPQWLALFRAWAESGSVRWWVGAAGVASLVPAYAVRDQLSGLAPVALYVALPLCLTLDRPRGSGPRIRDLAVILLLWLPLEFDLVSGERFVLKLVGLNLLLWHYVVERGLFEPGRIVPVHRKEWAWGVGCSLAFLVPGIPLALATGFVQPGLDRSPLLEQFFSVVFVVWLIALPEEALFRGTIQQLLERAWGARIGLVSASVIFGLAHFPDWRYILLATLAGGAYGVAYLRTGNLAAPILTHAVVDVAWGRFFAGPT